MHCELRYYCANKYWVCSGGRKSQSGSVLKTQKSQYSKEMKNSCGVREWATDEIQGAEDRTNRTQAQRYSFPHEPWKRGKRSYGRKRGENRATAELLSISGPNPLAWIPSYEKISSHVFARLHSKCLTLQFQIKLGKPILQPPVCLPESLLFSFV